MEFINNFFFHLFFLFLNRLIIHCPSEYVHKSTLIKIREKNVRLKVKSSSACVNVNEGNRTRVSLREKGKKEVKLRRDEDDGRVN